MKKILALCFLIPALSFAQKEKWQVLFDGKTTKGWHNYNKNEVTSWTIDQGALTTKGKGGDLLTDKEYENFELEFEFKVAPKGNSGVIYKVIERSDLSQPYLSGPEFQIIDDKNYPDPIKNTQKTGSNYDIQAANDLTVVKPAGEWNKGKIIVKNNHVEHWLNGKMVVEYEYGSIDWQNAVSKSKFANWEYAKAHNLGKISLQGHGDEVWYRKIRIKEL
jgi:hypothetical protein